MKLRGVLAAAAIAFAGASCNAIFGLDAPKPLPGTGGAAAGGGGAGGDGGGGARPCQSLFDCDGADDACGRRACDHGVCTRAALLPKGTVLAVQTPGDCKKNVCGADARVTEVNDDSDTFDDHNPCTLNLCVAGVKANPNSPTGSNCGNHLHCDGNGHCKGCSAPIDCGTDGPCFTRSCVNQICGVTKAADGSSCGACLACGTGLCAPVAPGVDPNNECPGMDACDGTGKCLCANGILDSGESDLDCGGSCSPCAGGKHCNSTNDCVSPITCTNGVCCNSPCNSPCQACSNALTGGTDGVCSNTTAGLDPDNDCAGADTCDGNGACRCQNGLRDGDETGTDCGGSVCQACAPLHWACDGCTGPGLTEDSPIVCCSAATCPNCPASQAGQCMQIDGTPCAMAGQKVVLEAANGLDQPGCSSLYACSHYTCSCQ